MEDVCRYSPQYWAWGISYALWIVMMWWRWPQICVAESTAKASRPYSVHNLYFWHTSSDDSSEIRSVLRSISELQASDSQGVIPCFKVDEKPHTMVWNTWVRSPHIPDGYASEGCFTHHTHQKKQLTLVSAD